MHKNAETENQSKNYLFTKRLREQMRMDLYSALKENGDIYFKQSQRRCTGINLLGGKKNQINHLMLMQ